MNENICMPKNFFYILFIIFLVIIIYNTYLVKKNTYTREISMYEIEKINRINKNIMDDFMNKEQEKISDQLPLRQFLENRDRSILYDPLKPPERRVDINQYPIKLENTINIPTRGYPDNYQLVGLLSRDSDEKILQLFGRATFPGSNQYEYYVTTDQYGFTNKIPIETKGKKEILDNDIIDIPIFDKSKGPFKLKLYNYDTPRYNPYIY